MVSNETFNVTLWAGIQECTVYLNWTLFVIDALKFFIKIPSKLLWSQTRLITRVVKGPKPIVNV